MITGSRVQWLELAAATIPECGGKARGLARLIDAGLQVPSGFVIVGLRSTVEIGELELSTWTERLGPWPYAVRSSALGEDGEQYSYAGQYESVLGIADTTALREAIARCLASLAGERVRGYEAGMGEREPSMAVIVQRMVDARCAGVLFTLDPMTGASDRWMIEAVAGLGEALMSGRAVPERHHINPEHPEHSTRTGTEVVLRPGELGRLVGQAHRFASGERLDMEWAIDHEGEIHWLQARPVARVGALALDELDSEMPSPCVGFTRYNIGEILPGAVTPMSASTSVVLLDAGMQRGYERLGVFAKIAERPQRSLITVSGHIFINMHAPYLLAAGVAGATKQAADRSLGGRVFDELEGLPARGKLRRLWTAVRMLPILRRSSRMVDRVERELRVMLASEPSDDHVAELEALLRFGLEAGEVHLLASTWSGLVSGVLEQMLGDGAPLDGELRRLFADLLAGIGAVESAEIGVELAALVELVRAEPSAAELLVGGDAQLLAWLRGPASGHAGRAFRAFLDRHGHRCIRELELREASWAEAPAPVLDVLRTGVANQPLARSEKPSLDRLALPAKSAGAIRWIVPHVHASIRVRERSKSLLVQTVRAAKRHVVALGEQLVARGRLAELDLVYFLTREELLKAVRGGTESLTTLTRRRRRALDRQATLRFAMVSRGKPTPLSSPPTQPGAARLIGTAVSSGVVEGRARVARTITEARELVPGEILIVPFTDAGWTPYFALAAGLATEIGGTLSHGAVVARELGLPTVVNLAGATELFETGQRVRLDADSGTLERV
jgi:phosphohistidine swiveling domain-containing protein